jgi:predicted ribosomally synthesized peptide with SipW-like signal peptide
MSSLMLVALVGITIGGTGAFFSDTETSAGNVFTAGAVDLKVDHQSATYNGEDCTTTCDPWAVEVVSYNPGLRQNGTAVPGSRNDPTAALGPAQTTGAQNDINPTGFVSLGFGGVIVLKFPNGIDDGPGDDIRIYEATGGNNYPVESLLVEVSGDGIDWTTIDVSPNEIEYDGTVDIDLNGVDTARYIKLTDTSDLADFPNLPTADGYDLDAVEAIHCDDPETDGVASDIWQCQLWEATDLENETFFNFSDIKPQDTGENVISLHVESNDAFACMNVVNKEDVENTINGPEDAAGDTTDPAGEMGAFLTVKGYYSDINGTEISELFPATPIQDLGTIVYADSTTGTPISGNTTEYIKLNWCMGEFNPDGSCNGSVSNINRTQTDAFLADLQFSVIQTRNNDDYVCPVSVI